MTDICTTCMMDTSTSISSRLLKAIPLGAPPVIVAAGMKLGMCMGPVVATNQSLMQIMFATSSMATCIIRTAIIAMITALSRWFQPEERGLDSRRSSSRFTPAAKRFEWG